MTLQWTPRVHVELDELGVAVDADLEEEGGRLVVRRLTITSRPDGPSITSDVLKSLPVVRIPSLAVAGALLGLLTVEKAGRGVKLRPADLDALPTAERAAVVYRAAHFLGMNPTSTVADVLGLSRDVAAKHVQAARLAGLLEPTTRGKKGA